jgi:hypothetical protein
MPARAETEQALTVLVAWCAALGEIIRGSEPQAAARALDALRETEGLLPRPMHDAMAFKVAERRMREMARR